MMSLQKRKIIRDRNLVKLYALSNPVCEITGDKPDLAPHHILYKSQSGGDNHENLIMLTRSLHEFCHFHGPKARDVLQSFKRGELTKHGVLLEFSRIHKESR